MNPNPSNRLSDGLVLPVSLLFIVAGLLELRYANPEYFVFHHNNYLFLSALTIVSHVGLLTALYLRKGFLQARLWLAIEISGSMLIGVGELLLRISTTTQQALFWANVSTIGIAIIPVGFYMFSQTFVGRPNRRFDAFLPAILTSTAGILLAFSLGQDSLSLIDKFKGFWGYAIPMSKSFLILSLWLGAIICLGLISFIKQYQTVKLKAQKQQTLIIIWGIAGSLFGALFLDILPRYFGHNILPIGVLMQTLMSLSIIYAIYKYDTFDVDFSLAGTDILNSLSEVVILTDSNFMITTVNRFGLKLSGYRRVELVGRPLSNLFSKAAFATLETSIATELTTNDPLRIAETSMIAKDASNVAVDLSVTKLGGGQQAFLITMNDISQSKAYFASEQERNKELESANEAFRNQQRAMMNLLEDSRDLGDQLASEKASVENKVEERTAEVKAERMRLEASINSLNVGFIIVDDKQQIITANQAFTTIIAPPDSRVQPSLDQLAMSLAGIYDIHKSIENCLAKGKETSKDALQYGAKTLRIFMAPIFEATEEHKSLGVVVLVEDITEAKAIERSRDEFFSIASHELRTPLTAIRGNTQMIKQYYPEALADPLLAEMVDDIHDSSIRLITIVNDFLDTSRLEQGKINFELTNFNVVDLIEDIMQEFKAGEVNPKLYIKLQVPKTKLPLIRADRDRLKQTIINLVGNAFKFTEKGGVTITVSVADLRLSIDVTDTGKGIPVESQSLLFRKFQQASNNILTRDSTRSTGLGLYISKLITEGMKGKIYMKSSQLGKGATFTIEMPVAPSKASRLGAKKTTPTNN